MTGKKAKKTVESKKIVAESPTFKIFVHQAPPDPAKIAQPLSITSIAQQKVRINSKNGMLSLDI